MPSDRVIEMLFYHIGALLPTQLLIPLLEFELIRQTTYFQLAKVRANFKCLSKFELNLLRSCHVTV